MAVAFILQCCSAFHQSGEKEAVPGRQLLLITGVVTCLTIIEQAVKHLLLQPLQRFSTTAAGCFHLR